MSLIIWFSDVLQYTNLRFLRKSESRADYPRRGGGLRLRPQPLSSTRGSPPTNKQHGRRHTVGDRMGSATAPQLPTSCWCRQPKRHLVGDFELGWLFDCEVQHLPLLAQLL
jgi:hypothetical protein